MHGKNTYREWGELYRFIRFTNTLPIVPYRSRKVISNIHHITTYSYVINDGGGVEGDHVAQEDRQVEVAENQVEVMGLVAGQKVDEHAADEQVREDVDPVAHDGENLSLWAEVDCAYFSQ